MTTRTNIHLAVLLGFAAAVSDVPAAESVDPQAARAAIIQQVDKTFAEHQRLYGSNTAFLVRRGLLADKARREVRLSAESIRLRTNAQSEFPLIASNSGKDYEALAVAFAVPSDVHAALLFIGLPRGTPIEPAAFRFWPKGERVRMTFTYRDDAGLITTTRVERLVIDTRTDKTIPEDDFVFTGSMLAPNVTDSATGNCYAADIYSPNAIAAIYNEPVSVLDVPRRAQQNEVYNFQYANPAIPLPDRQLIEVTLTPARTSNLPTVVELTLDIRPGEPAGEAAFELKDHAGALLNTNRSRVGVASAVNRIVTSGHDPFVTIRPDDALSLSSVAKISQWIETMDNERAMRVEPPPAGHPYFKTFLPNERFRDRRARPVQPIELRLSGGEGSLTGTVTFIEEEWKPGADESVLTVSNFPAASSQDLAKLLDRENAPRVLLVYADAGLTYGAVRRFLAPALTRRLILYVYLPAGERAN